MRLAQPSGERKEVAPGGADGSALQRWARSVSTRGAERFLGGVDEVAQAVCEGDVGRMLGELADAQRECRVRREIDAMNDRSVKFGAPAGHLKAQPKPAQSLWLESECRHTTRFARSPSTRR